MTDFATIFFSVFDAIAITWAITSGLSFGATVLLYLVLKHPPRIIATTWQHAVGAGFVFALAGLLFYAGQVTQTLASGEPTWPRVVARAALWQFFAISVGIGLGFARSFARKRPATRAEGVADPFSQEGKP